MGMWRLIKLISASLLASGFKKTPARQDIWDMTPVSQVFLASISRFLHRDGHRYHKMQSNFWCWHYPDFEELVAMRQHQQSSERAKVKSLSPHHRFVIALHSPDGVVETGLLISPPEKKPAKRSDDVGRTFSPVRVEGNNAEIGPVFRKFLSNLEGFLCTLDLLVALTGIEPVYPP
jgi:hypothetical protein